LGVVLSTAPVIVMSDGFHLIGPSAALGSAVAASLLVGALVAARITLPERMTAAITAFGGGVLLAAVAFELVPEASELAGLWVTAIGMLTGTVVFVGADAWLSREESTKTMRRSRHAAAAGRPMMPLDRAEAARGESIAAGIFVDGVPESIAVGLTLADGNLGVALLVGVLVGNLVEAYGAVRPIIASGYSKRFAVGLIAAIALALAGATVGGTLLADASPTLVGGAQAVAAGAVLAVLSISIIPYAFAEVSRLVAFAVATGFVGGYLLS
jgi:ZIP family zinc transporter